MAKTKKHDIKFLIFSLIGVFNTLFDLALYTVIYKSTNSIIIANIAATSAAMIGSYILNSRITFKAHKWTIANFTLFVAVTLFGLWVLQTAVIYMLTPLMNHIPEQVWQQFGSFAPTAKILMPKILATALTFVWNFMWYNKVIFKKDTDHVEEAIRSAEL